MKVLLALAAVAGGVALARSRGRGAADPWHQATEPGAAPARSSAPSPTPDPTAAAPSASPDTPAGSARSSENGTTPSGT